MWAMMNRPRFLTTALLLATSSWFIATPSGAAPGKKGACLITARQYEKDWHQRVEALKVDWHYSWGSERPADKPKGVEFVPMMWGWNTQDESKNDARLDSIMRQKRARKVTHLLGFNEPDGHKQANLSVDQAIAAWPKLMKTGLRLGSPAPVHAEREWLQEFMKQAEAKDYRVDFICVHWYGGPNAKGLVNKLKKIHQLYGKPIWLTEFCPADWDARKTGNNKHSPETVKKFMLEVLPLLDELDFVERYAWFTCRDDNLALHTSQLIRNDGTLTELGKVYAAHQSR